MGVAIIKNALAIETITSLKGFKLGKKLATKSKTFSIIQSNIPTISSANIQTAAMIIATIPTGLSPANNFPMCGRNFNKPLKIGFKNLTAVVSIGINLPISSPKASSHGKILESGLTNFLKGEFLPTPTASSIVLNIVSKKGGKTSLRICPL